MVSSNYKPKYDMSKINSLLHKIGYPKGVLDSRIMNMRNPKLDNKQMKIDKDTYDRLQRIKKDHKIFTKDVVGMSVLIMYELLYGGNFKINDNVSNKKIDED